MIYVLMPYGNKSGWGVCGKYIVRELAKLTEVRYVNPDFDQRKTSSELEYRYYRGLLASREELRLPEARNNKYPVLQVIDYAGMDFHFEYVCSPHKVGYTFFEDLVPAANVRKATSYFHIIAAGSTWCASILRENGHERAPVVLQGIDPLIFNPAFAEKEFFRDRFIVFSGGKFELRKGQDIVIRAYKVLQDKHPDVLLVNSWYNNWPSSVQTMEASSHIRFRLGEGGDHVTVYNRTLAENGIDLDRVRDAAALHQ